MKRNVVHGCGHIEIHEFVPGDSFTEETIEAMGKRMCVACTNAHEQFKTISPKRMQRIIGSEMRNARHKAPVKRLRATEPIDYE